MSLTGKTKAGSYKDLLQIDNGNDGFDTSARIVKSGNGNVSCLSLSDDVLMVQPTNDDTTSMVRISSSTGESLVNIDSTNDLVKAGIGQHIVNTQIQTLGLSSYLQLPSVLNTWVALFNPTHRPQSPIHAGTGSTPYTSFTIGGTADDMVSIMWYVPLNITIDSCHVWWGADASTADAVEFSVISYSVDTDNGSTGGDLADWKQVCLSDAPIANAGYQQAYYDSLTVSNPDVPAGRVILAFVRQAGVLSDLSVNMQLIYHLR